MALHFTRIERAVRITTDDSEGEADKVYADLAAVEHPAAPWWAERVANERAAKRRVLIGTWDATWSATDPDAATDALVDVLNQYVERDA